MVNCFCMLLIIVLYDVLICYYLYFWIEWRRTSNLVVERLRLFFLIILVVSIVKLDLYFGVLCIVLCLFFFFVWNCVCVCIVLYILFVRFRRVNESRVLCRRRRISDIDLFWVLVEIVCLGCFVGIICLNCLVIVCVWWCMWWVFWVCFLSAWSF